MKKYIHNRKFVIAEFNLEQLQEAEDFLNNEYPNYALVHARYCSTNPMFPHYQKLPQEYVLT